MDVAGDVRPGNGHRVVVGGSWSASTSTASTNRRITACARTCSPAAAFTSTVTPTSEPDEDAEDQWPQSPYYQYSAANGLPLDTQISAGPSVEIIWDSRDSFINPSHGWLARASYRTLFDGFLGGDSSWEKVNLDVRTYAPLSSDRRRQARGLGVRRSGRRRRGAVFRSAFDGRRLLRPFGTRLRRRALPGREAGVRRDRIPGAADAQRSAGHGGVREHHDDLQSTGRRTALRQLRAGREAPACGCCSTNDHGPTSRSTWASAKNGNRGVYLVVQEAF